MRSSERGFTLIELVVGIVLMAIALTSILGLLINQVPRAVDPVQQVRAAQLGQRLLGEILQRSFDEHSDHNGGRFRCGETVDAVPYPACTAPASYGPDNGESASYAFNDVDDYLTSAICGKGLTSGCDGDWVPANFFSAQSSQQTLDESEYKNYWIRIRIEPNDLFGSQGQEPESVGKHIALWVRLPGETELAFTLYRGNY